MDITTEDILKSIKNNNNLPMQTLGMPGPSHVMGLAKNLAQGIPPYLSDLYERMKRSVTQGPYSSPSGDYDPRIGTLPFEIMSPGYGRAAAGALETGLGAGGFKSSVGMRGVGGPRTPWTPEMQNRLKALNDTFKDTPGKQKLIIKNFREMHPDYEGSDNTILTMSQRLNKWGSLNKTPGSENIGGTELGAFGGQGRLNTPSYGESMGWLQSQKPVDKQWVENWAKDAGIDISNVKKVGPSGQNKGTRYFTLQDPDNPANTAKIRVPTDQVRHTGYANEGKAYQYYDTGYGHPASTRNYTEENLINQGGQSYANPEALDQALRLKFSKAPFGQNWLTSPDAAPRVPIPGQPTPPRPYQDPNQLKLLSSGFTPADILKVLQQNGQGQ